MKNLIALALLGIIAVSCGGNTESDIQEQVTTIEEKSQEAVAEENKKTEVIIEKSYLHFKIDGEEANMDELLAKKSIVQVMNEMISVTGTNPSEDRRFNISFSGDMSNPIGIVFTDLLSGGENIGQLTYGTSNKSYTLVSGTLNITKLDSENKIIEGTVSGKVAELADITKPELHKPIEGDFHMEGMKFKDLRSK